MDKERDYRVITNLSDFQLLWQFVDFVEVALCVDDMSSIHKFSM